MGIILDNLYSFYAQLASLALDAAWYVHPSVGQTV